MCNKDYSIWVWFHYVVIFRGRTISEEEEEQRKKKHYSNLFILSVTKDLGPG